ncbi:extracellular solute-binding protein [Lederbergia sp. NSJ-179]|uniref:ABC transporter substrate-binding protein n=1 Tax=Lederbergia sp. NSJ-179 TaxID=2931402 RepID=UPI001FD2F424|nr:extracellular solute-binding protein [Lederbergia sp. NSJ-179]MCJ7840715.1 extracellular solute-binding protein [Lederbergia sp. NSJ-179]
MKALSKVWLIFMLFSCLGLLLVACSKDSNEQTDATPNTEQEGTKDDDADNEEEKEPVTLKIQTHWEEEMFNDRFKEPVEAALPHITLEQVKSWDGREALEEIFASGENPDIFFQVSQEVLEYFEIDYDLDELVEKYSYDLSHINPAYIEAIRSKDKENRLLGLPYEVGYYVLFYNKDIFDLFGENYPSNNMTWSEVLEVAKRLTGERNGVKYRGLDLSNPNIPLMQFGVNKTDPETGEILLDQPEFDKYFELLDQIIDMQGDSDGAHFDSARFPEAQTTAMTVEFVQGLEWWKDDESLNAAVAPLPVWDGGPAVSQRPDTDLMALSINPQSEKKDAAFEVLTYFTEADYQKIASRQGIGPTTSNEEVLKEFFQDYDFADEANVASIFEHPPATPPEQISVWDQYVDLDPRRYSKEDMDRNEYLRVITEESEAKIQEAKASQ